MATPTATPPPPKPKCPECGTEIVLVNNDLPETCAKCGFILDGYEPFSRWMRAYEKSKTPETPTPAPRKKAGMFGGLQGRKK